MSSTKPIDLLLQKLWKDYSAINPQALKIHSLLTQRGETVLNDHVAFRTFKHPAVGIQRFEQVFLKVGYQPKGEYHFEEKKLFAKHYEHSDPSVPKIFISELLLDQFEKKFQTTLLDLIDQIPATTLNSDHFVVSGRPWSIPYGTYEELLKTSEYGAWMSAFGFRVNHFTVFVNSLKTFKGLEDLNSFLKQYNFVLNQAGGEIKGSADIFLAQSSTMAQEVDVTFTGGVKKIPGCYYEFAKRYPLPSGQLYQGFVTASADKIFESTHRN